MKVDFLVAGFQKCGTSALHMFLSKHPKIICSNSKEIDFFNYDKNYNKGYNYYHSFFKDKLLAELRGIHYLESSPSYLSDQNLIETAKRIKNYNKNIKIVGLVRDPIYRAYSAWNMYRNRYIENQNEWWIVWVEEKTGVKLDAKRRHADEFEDFYLFINEEIKAIKEEIIIECPVLSIGHYYKGIQVYKELFNNNIRIFKTEDLYDSTGMVLEEVAGFLNLKKFLWSEYDGIKIFKGIYKNQIPEKAKILLNEYYSDSNKKLEALTGIVY